jgi:hypothetical protein
MSTNRASNAEQAKRPKQKQPVEPAPLQQPAAYVSQWSPVLSPLRPGDSDVLSRQPSNLLSRQTSSLFQRQPAASAEVTGELPLLQLSGRNFAQFVGQSGSRPPVQPKLQLAVQREELDEQNLQAKFNHGMEGGEVDPGVASTIGSAKGRGDPLQNKVRSAMESGFGADFGGVRVHTDGRADALNRSLNARAFTTGNDIFFSKGQFNPESSTGRTLLAHELTHTIQQGAAPIQRQVLPLSRIGLTQITRNTPSIQRVPSDVLVTGVSHLVKMRRGTIYGGTEEREIIHGQQLTIETDSEINSRRGPNQEEYSEIDKTGPQHYKWYRVIALEGKKAPKDLYVREDVFVPLKKESSGSKLDQANDFVNAVTTPAAVLIGNEGITGMADALLGKNVRTGTAGASNVSESAKEHAKNLGIAGDSITGITGLMGLAKGFKDLGNPEQTAADLFVTFLEIEQGAMKTGESVSKLVNTLGEGGASNTLAKGLGSAFEGYGAAFGGIKEGFLAMKGFVDLIKNNQDYSTEEKARKSAEAGLHALEGARSVVLSIKAFIELVEGSASGGLMAAVPGLDIAISGVKLIMDGYYLAISNTDRKVMNERRKEIAQDKGREKDDLTSASEFYRTRDAEIVNKKEVLRDTEKRLAKTDNLKKWKGLKSASAKEKDDEKKKLIDRKKTLETEIALLEQSESDTGLSREDVAEFTLATELRDANTKRVVRQSIHIATEMAKIAGSIATLSGVGAMGGAATKGAAAAVDLALPATRMAKQAGRDRSARKMAKGKKTKSVFDHTKSTAAKADFRLRQVKHLIRLIVEFSYETDPKTIQKSAATIKTYLKASGVDENKLFKANGDPQKQIKMLVDAVQKREFL